MNQALPDASISGFETIITGPSLPDPNDRHVLAVAIKTGAQVIVISNLKDFPPQSLSALGIEAKGPDDFLVDQFHISEQIRRAVVRDIALSWSDRLGDRTFSSYDVLDRLERSGMVQLAALARS